MFQVLLILINFDNWFKCCFKISNIKYISDVKFGKFTKKDTLPRSKQTERPK